MRSNDPMAPWKLLSKFTLFIDLVDSTIAKTSLKYTAFPVHRELQSDHQSKSFLVKNYLGSHSSIRLSFFLNRSNHPGLHSDIGRSILVIQAHKLVFRHLWYQKKVGHSGSLAIKRNLRSLAVVQSNTTSWGFHHMHRISCPWCF